MSCSIRLLLSSYTTEGSQENFIPNGRMSHESFHGQEEMVYSGFILAIELPSVHGGILIGCSVRIKRRSSLSESEFEVQLDEQRIRYAEFAQSPDGVFPSALRTLLPGAAQVHCSLLPGSLSLVFGQPLFMH